MISTTKPTTKEQQIIFNVLTNERQTAMQLWRKLNYQGDGHVMDWGAIVAELLKMDYFGLIDYKAGGSGAKLKETRCSYCGQKPNGIN